MGSTVTKQQPVPKTIEMIQSMALSKIFRVETPEPEEAHEQDTGLLNVLKSFTDIQKWFANKKSRLQNQVDNFRPCFKCSPTEQYSSCLRRKDILLHDIAHYEFLKDREIAVYRQSRKSDDLNDLLKWYGLEKALLREQIEALADGGEGGDRDKRMKKLIEKLEDFERGEERQIEVGIAKGWF